MKMKTKMLWGYLLLFCLFACKEKEEAADVLSLSNKVLAFTNEAETQTVLVSGTPGWKVECTSDWCMLDPTQDDQKGMFSVMVTRNPGYDTRSTVIKISAGNCVEEIDVLQQGVKTNLELSNNALKVFDLNEECTVMIYTNQPWKAMVSGDWLRVEPSSGTGDGIVRMFFPKNLSASERKGVVTFIAGDDSQTFELVQEAVLPDDRLHDSLALVALYNALNGPTWDAGNAKNWCTSEPIDKWTGIGMANGRVDYIVLSGHNKSGECSIPEEVKYLTRAREISLDRNFLTGRVPREFARCINIGSLSFSASVEGGVSSPGNLTGNIPLEYVCLPKLSVFNFRSNKITGVLPVELCVGAMAYFDATDNQLTGTIPPQCDFGGLRLAGNAGMSGPIPPSICAKVKAGLAVITISGTQIEKCKL